jgi:sortase A
MRVIVLRKSLRAILRWSQAGLFACAAVLLGYCTFVLVDTHVFQERESRELQRLLDDQHAKSGDSPQAKLLSPPEIPSASAINGLIGRIEIERLGLSVIVIEGDDGKTLRRAAGHVRGTALPGQRGNVGITGHRDTFFRPLRNVHLDDVITLTTFQGPPR